MYCRSLWAAPGRKTREGGGRGWAARLPPPLGQGESASLMACSLCRCHLVIILRKPSASCSCRARALSLLGRVWLAGSVAAFASILTRPSDTRPKCRGWFGPQGGQRTHTERQKKGKLWSPCHIGCWDKLMMQLQVFFWLFFFFGTWAPFTADCSAPHPLSESGMQRLAAKTNSSLHLFAAGFT